MIISHNSSSPDPTKEDHEIKVEEICQDEDNIERPAIPIIYDSRN